MEKILGWGVGGGGVDVFIKAAEFIRINMVLWRKYPITGYVITKQDQQLTLNVPRTSIVKFANTVDPEELPDLGLHCLPSKL